MKRLSVFLFLMMVVLCVLYGYSFFVFENNHNEIVDSQRTSDSKSHLNNRPDLDDQVDATTEVTKEVAATNIVEGTYLLKLEQNQLQVYQSSDQSVYMSIDAESLRLSDELKQEYEAGVYVDNEQELYSLLESISS